MVAVLSGCEPLRATGAAAASRSCRIALSCNATGLVRPASAAVHRLFCRAHPPDRLERMFERSTVANSDRCVGSPPSDLVDRIAELERVKSAAAAEQARLAEAL